jgi:hypothetical protein
MTKIVIGDPPEDVGWEPRGGKDLTVMSERKNLTRDGRMISRQR